MGLIILSMHQLIENLNISKVNIFIYLISISSLVIVVTKILIYKYRLKDKKNIVIFKVLGYLLLIQTVILFVSESIHRTNNGLTGKSIYIAPIIYTLVTVKIIATLKLGYFKNWFNMELFKIRYKSEYIGVLEGLKYLIYTWIVMVSLLNFEMSSLSISIAGLMIALGSITLGFNKKMKGLRLYGLAVTLLMVFKVIAIDMGDKIP